MMSTSKPLRETGAKPKNFTISVKLCGSQNQVVPTALAVDSLKQSNSLAAGTQRRNRALGLRDFVIPSKLHILVESGHYVRKRRHTSGNLPARLRMNQGEHTDNQIIRYLF